MKYVTMGLPTFGFIVGTRIALALGVGLLLSGKLSQTGRRRVGTALVALGALTTVPAARSMMRSVIPGRRSRRRPLAAAVRQDSRLIGATRFPRKGDEDDL